MNDTRTDRRTQRALTTSELDTIHDAIDAAGSAGAVLVALVRTLYDMLLAGTATGLTDHSDARRLDPATFAIPLTQWNALAAMACARAAAWGAQASLGMELVNVMPASYDDPDAPVPSRPPADHRPGRFEVHLSREAADTVAACQAHLDALADFYGSDSRIWHDAARSWQRQLASLLCPAFGTPAHISRDGQLSLYVSAPGLAFGVIFHGASRHCTAAGCHAIIDEDGTARPAFDGAVVVDHEHSPSYPLGAPQPGTWSMHS